MTEPEPIEPDPSTYLSRLIEVFPYSARELLQGVTLEIKETCLVMRCGDAATRNRLHQEIEQIIGPIAWLLPQIDMLSLEAPNVRRLPIPVSLALVGKEEELIFPAGTIEARKILDRRIATMKLCEVLIGLSRHVVFILDLDGAILDTNITRQTYGIKKEDAIGRLIWEVCPISQNWRGIQEACRLNRRYSLSVDRVVMGQTVKFSGVVIPCKESIVLKLTPDPVSVKLLALH